MTRPYSDRFILGLHHADSRKIGIKLAKVCIKAGLPSVYVADTFSVLRKTIHLRFRGSPVRDKNNTRIEHFIELVEQALANGDLPAADRITTKKYLELEIKPNLIKV